jgi:hypothetical protein
MEYPEMREEILSDEDQYRFERVYILPAEAHWSYKEKIFFHKYTKIIFYTFLHIMGIKPYKTCVFKNI